MGLALLVVATLGVIATATLLLSTLRLRSPVSFTLGVFTAAWALVVFETMLLSLARSWTRGWMLAVIAAGLSLSFAVWHATGRPRPPTYRPALNATREALRDPLLAIFAAALLLAYAYLAVVALAIPPMDPDVLAYHLPRIVLWIQQHAVAAIPDSPGPNLDANPPAAEIAQGLGPLFAVSDRYASLFQLVCAPAAAVAVAGIARRLGLTPSGSVFGGLVFASFPIVALQAPTAANDLATATALILAAYFGLGRPWGELGLMALAVALALSTKVSGILALPAVGLFLVLALPARRLSRVGAAAIAGGALGCWWYAANLARTGSWDGGLASEYDQVPSHAPADVLLRLCRYLLQTIDLGGVVGRDRLVFPIVAAALVCAALVARRRGRPGTRLALAGLLVAVTPWLVAAGHQAAARAIAHGWLAVGRDDVLSDIPLSAAARPSPGEAWFGPALVLLWIATLAVLWRRPREVRGGPVLGALAAAPALLYLTNSAAFVWDPGRGRFFILAAALAAAAFGIVLRIRAVAWATMSIAVLALGLSLLHFRARPAGITLFEPIREATMWAAPRWQVNSAFSADVPAIVRTQRLGERALRAADTLAVRAGPFTPVYIVFGTGPWHRVLFVEPDGVIPPDADHLVVFGSTADVDTRAWRRVPGPTTWRLYRRISAPTG